MGIISHRIMHGIFTYIYRTIKNQLNVGKYTVRPMDPMGYPSSRGKVKNDLCSRKSHWFHSHGFGSHSHGIFLGLLGANFQIFSKLQVSEAC